MDPDCIMVTERMVLWSKYPIGSMYAIYMVTFTSNIPQMLAYIYHTWILWVHVINKWYPNFEAPYAPDFCIPGMMASFLSECS